MKLKKIQENTVRALAVTMDTFTHMAHHSGGRVVIILCGGPNCSLWLSISKSS